MFYINTTTGEYPVNRQQLVERLPDVPFVVTREFLLPHGYDIVFQYDDESLTPSPYEFRVFGTTPVIKDGFYQLPQSLVSHNPETIEAIKESKWVEVRKERDALLAETDFAFLPDAKIASDVLDELQSYRQALRDVTLQDDPFNVEYPIKPTV